MNRVWDKEMLESSEVDNKLGISIVIEIFVALVRST
jgi:hypothetical protein